MRISDWSSDVCSSDLDVVHKTARHHRGREGVLPPTVEAIWTVLRNASESDGFDRARMDGCRAALGEADRLYAPAVTELEREQAVLWQRTARAEAAVAEQALSGIGKEALARLSGDLARTQAEQAGAIAPAPRLAVRTALARAEERRVGEGGVRTGRPRGAPYNKKK